MHWLNRLRLALGVLLASLLFSFLLAFTRAAPPPPDVAPEVWPKIEPLVLKELAEESEQSLNPHRMSVPGASESKVVEGGKTTYIIHLKEQADLRPAQLMTTKLARRQGVVSALQTTAQRTQADIIAYLEQQKSAGQVADYTPYWIFNGLAVTGDLETLLALAARPEVDKIRANHKHQIQPPTSNLQPPTSNLQSVVWNIAQVRADDVWRDFDIAGAGVVVANMDTGVDWTHPALQSKYRGSDGDHNYNWYDCTGAYPSTPADGDGHGTHTMGVIVGSAPDKDFHIGMAPDAQWIAVKILDDDGIGYDTWVHAGFQWLLAPTDLNGSNPDPGKAPDVVNNSWGPGLSNVADLTFLPDVQALRAAGIFPAFSAGNSGELGDGTVAAPAGYPESFAVGATDFEDAIASFSGRGPSFWEELKPEVSAPGVDIRSSVPGGGYEGGWSGTSMAVPHAAGLVALLLSADPDLTISELENFMKYTAADLGDVGPDNTYGWGQIDAYEAVRWALGAGKLYGKVTASNAMGEGLPTMGEGLLTEPSPPRSETFGERAGIPGATVSGVSQAHDQFIVTTDNAGVYEVSVPGGLYDVTASAFGYYSETVRAVEVITGFMSVQYLTLQPSPTGTLAGRVLEAGTGEPLTATISAVDTPASTSTDASGYYTLTLPVGDYAIKTASHSHKAQTVTEVSIAAGEHHLLDFALETAPSILLVDADVWIEDSVTSYYQWALDYEGYFYDTRPITDTDYLPTAAELAPYDVVLWASPWSSPGYINADEELIAYLDNGGRLLISGQDIGYWDSKWVWSRAPLFYHNYLYADYVRDNTGINDLKGVDGDILEGVDLVLEDVYAYKRGAYLACDEVMPGESFAYATSIIGYEGDGSGGLKTDVCEPNPYKAVYLAFGYEEAGPRPGYADVLDRAIQWLIAPRPLRATSLRPKSQYKVGEAETSVQYSARVVNDGQTVGAYDLSLSGNAWPTFILDAQTMNPVTRTEELSPCGWQDLLVQVDIPSSAAVGEVDTVAVQATMADDPSISSTTILTTRAFPAWDYKSWMLTSRYRLAAATVGCEVYAIGGWDWTGASIVNEMYNPVANFWTPKASKPTGAANVGAAVINDRIYVVGGMSNRLGVLKAVEVYDPATDSWSSAAPLPVGLSGVAVAALRQGPLLRQSSVQASGSGGTSGQAAEGKLYVFGGDTRRDDVDTTYEYDPTTETWTQKAPMPGGPRSYAAATALNGKIYVAGGWPDLRTFEEYDPATDTWATKALLLRGRQSPGLVAIGDYVYAVGGGSAWSALGSVERYDPATDTWVLVASLNKGRIGTGTAAAGGGIYVASGVDIYGEAVVTNEGLALVNSLCPSSKKVDKVTASPGEVLTYTISLHNFGDTDFAGVSLVDPIPAHATYVLGSVNGGASYNAETGQIEWSGTVAAGTSIPFTYQVVLDDPLLGGTTIANVAAVNDGQGTSFTKKTATRVQAANLEPSTKDVDKTEALSSEVLSYTITFTNTGTIEAVSASLVDSLPAHITYVPDSATGGAVYDPVLHQIKWTGVVSVTVPERTTYGWLDSGTPGGPLYDWEEISETGTEVTSWTNRNDGFAGPFDIGFDFPFFGNVYSNTLYLGTNGYVSLGQGYSGIPRGTLPTSSFPNNDIMPFGGPLYIMDGVSHVYYQLLRPDGSTSSPRRLVEGLDDPTRFVIEYVDVQWCCGLNTSHTFEIVLYPSGEILTQYKSLHGDIPWLVGIENEDGSEGLNYPPSLIHDDLAIKYLPPSPPSPPYVIGFQARVNDGILPETIIANTATINDGMGFSYTRTATTGANMVDLSTSTKTVEEAIAVPGDVLTYTIVLRNGGKAAEAGFTDPIPANASYASGSVAGGAIYDEALNRVQWSGTMPARSERAFTFAVTTDRSLPDDTSIVNVATITDELHLPFTRTAATILKRPNLSLSEKLVSAARAAVGDTITYTLRVKNTGESLANAILTDTIPAGSLYVPGSAWTGNGTVVHDAVNDRIIWNGEVPSWGMSTIVFAVTVTEERVINNTVTIDDRLGGLTERSATTKVLAYDVYLPLLVKNYSP